jgi:uncharacterized membrane protein
MTLAVLLLSVLLACAVEAVEALTVVLAVGVTRQWRSTWQGVGAGLVVLAAVVAALGPALTRIPISGLRVVIGGLLLVFGLQWLRKAILRGSGYKALHDEEVAYRREVDAAGIAAPGGRFAVDDWYAFTVSFKAVLLEGLEVAFIVVTFGATQHRVGWATLAAAVALPAPGADHLLIQIDHPVGVLVGGALGLSGAVLQGLTRTKPPRPPVPLPPPEVPEFPESEPKPHETTNVWRLVGAVAAGVLDGIDKVILVQQNDWLVHYIALD